MKGKYTKKKQKNHNLFWVILAGVFLIAFIGLLWVVATRSQEPPLPPPETTLQQPTQTQITETTLPAETEAPFQAINLGYGVYIEKVGSYTGIYMEDGSDQLVSGVMMIRIHNTGDDDIQLMNVLVHYTDADFRFMVTNLPAGATAVVLERDRKACPEGVPTAALAENVVLFEEKMDPRGEMFEISGMDGALNVKNISDTDVTGDIYVYYKYKTQDIYYGGITFRVSISGGLKAGEVRQIMTSHFNPDSCEVLLVQIVETNEN